MGQAALRPKQSSPEGRLPPPQRICDDYRAQSRFWRALTFVQLPTTIVAVVAAVLMQFTGDTFIRVPDKPLPAQFPVEKLPDRQFLKKAEDILALIATYRFETAREQFEDARKLLWEPALSKFQQEVLNDELKKIEQTGRTQMFFIERRLVKIDRESKPGAVVVRHRLRARLPVAEAAHRHELRFRARGAVRGHAGRSGDGAVGRRPL